jgi:hypothetical protein
MRHFSIEPAALMLAGCALDPARVPVTGDSGLRRGNRVEGKFRTRHQDRGSAVSDTCRAGRSRHGR